VPDVCSEPAELGEPAEPAEPPWLQLRSLAQGGTLTSEMQALTANAHVNAASSRRTDRLLNHLRRQKQSSLIR
jgi:hypothetical protein